MGGQRNPDGVEVNLIDTELHRCSNGTMVFPSSIARGDPHGGGYVEDYESFQHIPDGELFPAIVLDWYHGMLLTPSGVRRISKYSCVSRIGE